MEKTIEIPFGAKDSELKGWEYTIPEGMEAEIKDGKIIVKQKESEDERIRTRLIALVEAFGQGTYKDEMLAYLERQKEPHFTKRNALFDKCVENCDPAIMKEVSDSIDKTLEKEQGPMHFLEIPAGDIAPAEEDGPFDEDEFLDGELSAFLQNYDKEYDDDAAVSDVARHFYEIGKKQKEQKLIEDVIRNITKNKEAATKFLKSAGIMDDNGELAEMYRSEQKPAEWSEDWREEDIQTRFAFYTYKDDPSVLYLSNVFVEEASRNHGFGTRILGAAEKVAEVIGATTISLKVKQGSPANAWYRKNGYGYVTFEDGYDWLEKNLEYMKPYKQEWSEEDEKNIKQLIDIVSALGGVVPNIPNQINLISWLKSLSPQPKAEWMAGQGISMQKTDDTEWEEVDSFIHKNVDGGSIIQIRKK